MRNLVPLGSRRWRLPMAQDPDAAPGGLETVVGSCYDAQTRVVYVVTSACNLYGIHIGKDSGGGDASRPFLRMSLLVGGGETVTIDGQDHTVHLDRSAAHEAFWFAWSQFRPDTLLWPG